MTFNDMIEFYKPSSAHFRLVERIAEQSKSKEDFEIHVSIYYLYLKMINIYTKMTLKDNSLEEDTIILKNFLECNNINPYKNTLFLSNLAMEEIHLEEIYNRLEGFTWQKEA